VLAFIMSSLRDAKIRAMIKSEIPEYPWD